MIILYIAAIIGLVIGDPVALEDSLDYREL